MNELPDLLKTLHFKYVEQQLAHLMEEARLPVSKTLDAFDFSFQPSINERQVRELADLSFVRTHSNVIFLGPPGVGKTH